MTLWLGDTTELDSRTEHLLHDTCRTWKSLRLRVSTAVMKLRDGKQLGEGDVYSAYTSIALFINEGRRGRNSNWAGIGRQELMQGHGGVLVPSTACSPWLIQPAFLSHPVPPDQEQHHPHGLDPGRTSLIKKMPSRMTDSPSLWRHFLTRGSASFWKDYS